MNGKGGGGPFILLTIRQCLVLRAAVALSCFCLPLKSPQCLAAVPGPLKVGDIVVTQQSSGSIYKVDPSTGIATLAMSNNSLTGLAQVILDSQNRALAATRSTYGILRFNFATGVAESVASGPFLANPYSLAFDHAGDLIVGSGDDWLTRINLTTGVQQHLSHFTSSTVIQDIEVGSNGLIYVLDGGVFPSGGGRVLTVDPLTGSQNLLVQGGDIYQGSDMAIEADGNLIISTSKNMSSKFVRVDAHTGQQQLLFSHGDEGFIALDADGSLLFAEFYANSVQRINLSTGSSSTFGHITSVGNLTGIAVVLPVPEPSVMALAALSVFIVAHRRWSRCR
jgi:streptogramin lyase